MSTIELLIDKNMYNLYVGDATTQSEKISEILEAGSIGDCNDAELEKIIQFTQAINGGAKLCKIPYVTELTDQISRSLTLLLKNGRFDDNDIQILLLKGLSLLNGLNNTEFIDAEAWFDTHSLAINELINNLSASSETRSSCERKSIKSDNGSKQKKASSGIDVKMLGLFKIEAEAQAQLINDNLLLLEEEPGNNSLIEPLMRAAHSIKGAARMIGLDDIVSLAHKMEDCFVNTGKSIISLDHAAIDILLTCNDILDKLHKLDDADIESWLSGNSSSILLAANVLENISNGNEYDSSVLNTLEIGSKNQGLASSRDDVSKQQSSNSNSPAESSVRIRSDRLNTLMALSNEILVSNHWLENHMSSLHTLKKRQTELASNMAHLKYILDDLEAPDELYSIAIETETRIDNCRQALSTNINQLEEFNRKSFNLTSRLNQEVIASRMRSFSNGVHGFKRMVRDVSHTLGKQVRLTINGLDTLVDSDILDKLEAPLTHLIRNAIDHGIEPPEERIANGKDKYGTITITAIHNSGRLNISIEDDGRGIDTGRLQKKIIEEGHVSSNMADKLSESELLDFLFLPGFSTRTDVTEFSGRGVGLDIVHNAVTEMRGKIQSRSTPGTGLSVLLQLPVTLSVLHTLLILIGNEYYAIPLSRIHSITTASKDDIFSIENKQLIKYNNQDISLINANTALEYCIDTHNNTNELNIIIFSERGEYYAFAVDNIIGEEKFALHVIDQRLGKLKNISAAAITDDGQPVFILDVDDLLVNIHEMISGNRIGNIDRSKQTQQKTNIQKILVIDDSLTVREVEKNLLETHGYNVDTAIDGADGWNKIRQYDYDLVITDIDMPRMNGIELVSNIKADNRLQSIPVMIVSYKDNPEDRQAGLEVGADYYLTKGSFHDESLIDAVSDLIGEPTQ